MRKRVFALLAAGVLATSCFGAVSAADEEEGNPLILKYENEIMTVDNNIIFNGDEDDYHITNFLDDEQFLEEDANYNAEDVLARLNAQQKASKNNLVSIFNLDCDGDEDDPVVIKFVENDVKGAKGYQVYSYDVKTGIWDSTDVAVTDVKDGVVTVNAKTSAPIAIVKTKGNGASGNTTANNAKKAPAGNGASDKVSKAAPKTGEV